MGGFSICDVLSCLLSCGQTIRTNSDSNSKNLKLDFRKRFELSMDKDRQAEYAKTRASKGERKVKSVTNYLSQTAKSKNFYLSEGPDPQLAFGQD